MLPDRHLLPSLFVLFSQLTLARAEEGDFAALMAEKQRAKHVQAWQRYGFVGIPMTPIAPVVDGNVEVREWTCAASIGHAFHMAKGMMVGDLVRFNLAYTDSHLYLAFQFARPDTARKPSARDFFELLLDVGHAHGRYHNLAVNMDEELWSGIGPNVDRKAWTPKYEYKARLTSFGWEGELAIPFAEFAGFDRAPAPGTIWGIDLVRNERTPTDRLAQWAWRSKWAASKDLAHLMFTGEPVAVRAERIGWMPQHKQMGASVFVSNFGNEPVALDASLELRKAPQNLTMQFLPALDSALTEDLDAAIGTEIETEVQRALTLFALQQEVREPVIVPAQTTKRVALLAADEPGNYLLTYCLRRQDALLAAMPVPFTVSVPLNLSLKSYLFSAGLLTYSADLRRVQDKLTPGSEIRLEARLSADQEPVATSSHSDLVGKEEVAGELKFTPQPGATYHVTATLRDGGTEIAKNTVPVMVPEKPEWIGNQVGRSKFVPRPWKPLVADARHLETLLVRYDWVEGQLLPNVRVKDRDILAEPLGLVFRDGDGNDVPLHLDSRTLRTKDDERAEYRFAGKAGQLGTVEGTMSVEFDGFMWVDLTFAPNGETSLSLVQLRATLKNEFARLYTTGRMAEGTHYLVPEIDQVGRVPDEGLAYPFTFQTWLGYVEGGLQWYCENNRNWHNANPKEALRLVPGEDATSLLVNYVDKPITVEKPLDWHFGLMPTPSKTEVGGAEDHAYFQCYGVPNLDEPDEALKAADPKKYAEAKDGHDLYHGLLKERGVKAVILFSAYNDLFGYPGFRDPALKPRMRAFVDLMHSQGIKVLTYNGWGITTQCDEWEQFGTELVNLPLKNSGYSTYWNSPVSLYPDLFLYRLREHLLECGHDGLYMDSTTSVSYSTHPNGMAWIDDQGRKRGSYPVRAMRDFTKRIYKLVNGEVLKDGLYYNHHSPQANVCIENFTSVRCPSEFAQSYDGPLDMDFVDYFLAKNGGIQYGYHTELTNKNWMTRIRKTLNELNTIAVPTGVSFKAINFKPWTKRDYSVKGQPMDKLWAAFAWLDSSKAEHLPWWRNSAYLSTDPTDGVLTALWLRKGERALVCVSNLPDEEREISVTLNLEQLGMKQITIEDAILGAPVEHVNGVLQLKIESQRWRLLKAWQP